MIEKVKLNDLLVSKKNFDKNKITYYKVTKIKTNSLLIDVITKSKKVFWTEIPKGILDDYEYLSVFKNQHPEYFL